jgi:hypothetical protein
MQSYAAEKSMRLFVLCSDGACTARLGQKQGSNRVLFLLAMVDGGGATNVSAGRHIASTGTHARVSSSSSLLIYILMVMDYGGT